MLKALEAEYEKAPAKSENLDSRIENTSNSDESETRFNHSTPRQNSDDDQFTFAGFYANAASDLWTVFRFELIWWLANLEETEVESRSSGLSSKFKTTDGTIADFENRYGSPLLRLEIGLHPVISLGAQFYRVDLTSERRIQNSGFTFDGQNFSFGQNIESQFDVTSADLYLNVHFLNIGSLQFDLLAGLRYFKLNLEYQAVETARPPAHQRFEHLLPMVGFGVLWQPINWLHLFGRWQFGAFKYSSSNSNSANASRATENLVVVFAAEAGLRFTIYETVEFQLGARFENFEVNRDQKSNSLGSASSKHEIKGSIGGPYLGLTIKF